METSELLTRYQSAQGRERVALALELFEKNLSAESDQARGYADVALREALAIGDPVAEARARMAVGRDLSARGLHGQALDSYFIALPLFIDHGRDRETADCHNKIGISYYFMGIYDEALDQHFKALGWREKNGTADEIGKSLNNIGLVYYGIQNYDRALEYYQRALQLKLQTGDQVSVTRTLSNIGYCYYAMGRFDEALEYHRQAMAICEQIDFIGGAAYALNNMGTIYLERGEQESALHTFERAFSIYESLSDEHGLCLALINMGVVHTKLGNLERAEELLKRAVSLSEANGYKPRLRDAYEVLSTLAVAQGVYRDAFDWYIKFDEIRDEILNEVTTRRISDLQVGFDAEARRREIELLRKNNIIQELQLNRQRQLRNFGIAGILALLVVIAVLGLMVRLLRRNQRELQARRVQLEAANAKLEASYDDAARLARIDPLTQLANRREFMRRLNDEAIRYHRSGQEFCVAMADIDDFKRVNDTWGHPAGDAAIKTVARLFSDCVRRTDVVGRWGGEEYIFLLPVTDSTGAVALLEKMRNQVRRANFEWDGHKIQLSLSFGVASFENRDIEAVIREADDALIRAKRAGKDRVECAGT